jgi:KDO2-lipid IV(A) lauroyltransferase
MDGFLSIVTPVIPYLVARKYWVSAQRNLAYAYGREVTEKEVYQGIRGMFTQLGRQAVEFIYRYHDGKRDMPSDKIDEVVGREHLEEALRRKRGVIIISAHLGNFTMLSSALAAMGFTECATIMKPTKDEETERIFSMIRERLGIRWSNQGSSRRDVMSVVKFLRNNGILILIIDQRMTSGVGVKFFGREKLTARGPAALAMRIGSTVLPAYAIAVDGGKSRIIIEPPLDLVRTGDTEKDIYENTQLFTNMP